MKTIVLSASATPNMNLAKINIDNAGFDPHCGPSFWVTFYNPTGNIIDRVTHSMTFDQWQDWTSESSEIADYKYIADSITEDLGITYISMDYPLPPVPPTISMQPVSQSNLVGNSALFSVGYTGDSPFTLQWYKDNVAIQGQTNSSFSIGSISESDAGSYTIKITNAGGSITSNAAILTVIVPVTPTITTQPENKNVEVGGSTDDTTTSGFGHSDREGITSGQRDQEFFTGFLRQFGSSSGSYSTTKLVHRFLVAL